MWKKEDVKPQGAIRETPPAPAPVPVPIASSTPAHSAPPAAVPLPVSPRAAACISQGIRIKGEVSGSEDLFVDGQVEGKLSLSNGSLTVGPNGSVKADLNAREVIVRGTVEGKVSGRDRVQLWSTGRVNGEVQTERLAIEEGAVLRQSGSGQEHRQSHGIASGGGIGFRQRESSGDETHRLGNGGGLSDELSPQTRNRSRGWDEPPVFTADSVQRPSPSRRRISRHRRSAHAGADRIFPRLERIEGAALESRRARPRHAARPRAGVADHAEFFHRARLPRFLGRYSPKLENVSG